MTEPLNQQITGILQNYFSPIIAVSILRLAMTRAKIDPNCLGPGESALLLKEMERGVSLYAADAFASGECMDRLGSVSSQWTRAKTANSTEPKEHRHHNGRRHRNCPGRRQVPMRGAGFLVSHPNKAGDGHLGVGAEHIAIRPNRQNYPQGNQQPGEKGHRSHRDRSRPWDREFGFDSKRPLRIEDRSGQRSCRYKTNCRRLRYSNKPSNGHNHYASYVHQMRQPEWLRIQNSAEESPTG